MDEQGTQNRWDNSWVLKPGFSAFLLGTKNPLPFASSMWVRKGAWERRSTRKSEAGEPLRGPGRVTLPAFLCRQAADLEDSVGTEIMGRTAEVWLEADSRAMEWGETQPVLLLFTVPFVILGCLFPELGGITGHWRSAGGGWYREIWSDHLLTSLLNKFTVGVPAPHSGGAQLLLLMMQFSAELRDCPKSCELATYITSDQIVGQACSNHASFLFFTYIQSVLSHVLP